MFTSILGLLVNQTQAYNEYYIQMYMPKRITLSAGPLQYAMHYLANAWGKLMFALEDEIISDKGGEDLERGCGITDATTISPAGRPLPWQAALPAGPFTTANLATGNLFTEVPVVQWSSLGRPMYFALYHNVCGDDPLAPPYQANGTPFQPGKLGEKWSHSYSRCIVPDPAASNRYIVYFDEGNYLYFTQKPGYSYLFVPPPGIHMELRVLSTTYKLTYKNWNVDIFDRTTGRLQELKDASGNTITLQYGSDNIVDSVTDAAGSVLYLDHDTNGILFGIHAPPIGPDTNSLDRDYAIEVSYDSNLINGIVRVSTARVAEEPPHEHLYWAEFHTTDNRLEQIVDRRNNSTEFEYYQDGILTNEDCVLSVTSHLANQPDQVRQFAYTEYTCMYPVGAPEPYYSIICTAAHTGVRTPNPDRTSFRFDGQGRLQWVGDPLNRLVTQVTQWSALNDPLRTVNVLGGETVRTFNTRGDVTSIQPPTGGPSTFYYDPFNYRNLLTSTDPLGNITEYEYNDAANPTRPTKIDGPGVSDVSLTWGQIDFEKGKLRQTISPNGITQKMWYGGGEALPRPPGMNPPQAGNGQVCGTTHGQGEFPQGDRDISDTIQESDDTGTDTTTSEASACNAGNAGLSGEITSLEGDGCVYCAVTGGGCAYLGDACKTGHDADGNVTSACADDCLEMLNSPQPILQNLFDGDGRPLTVYQPWISFAIPPQNPENPRYDFTYDPLGRKTSQTALHNGSHESQVLIHPTFCAPFDYQLTWAYNDSAGTVTRTYDSYVDGENQPGSKDVSTVIETDPAGRISEITQNGQNTWYEYNDSTSIPAVIEHKPNGITTEYYVDASGQTRKIVHKRNVQGTDQEFFALEYLRDAKQRVYEVNEVVNQDSQTASTTTYTYGDGHLTDGPLLGDPENAESVYYRWFANFLDQVQESDPNRLVKEVRTGAFPYHHEYWYDAGGNRLALAKSDNVGSDEEPDYRRVEITRYNYARTVDFGYDDIRLHNAEPVDDPEQDGWPALPRAINAYDAAGGQGQDKLLSRTTYYYDQWGNRLDSHARYTVYDYREDNGDLSLEESYDSATRLHTKKTFKYDKHRVYQIVVMEGHESADLENGPLGDWQLDAFTESYAYNIFGERIGTQHWDNNDPGNIDPAYEHACKQGTNTFAFVDGQVLVERALGGVGILGGTPDGLDLDINRVDSVYTWGPMGLIARRGASVNDGHWDSQAEEWVDENPNSPCDYVYLADGMGNTRGLVDANGAAQIQVFDAFGNIQGHDTVPAAGGLPNQPQPGHLASRCNSDCDYGDADTDPDPPQPVERMQAGAFNWRGGEGSQTDRLRMDERSIEPGQEGQLSAATATRPSTGLIFMQARFYDPALGRFTQADPVKYDPGQLMTGQQNRWNYCNNDPVNLSDPSGMFPWWGIMWGAAQIGAGAFLLSAGDVFGGISTILSGIGTLLAEIANDGPVNCYNVGLKNALLTLAALCQLTALAMGIWGLGSHLIGGIPIPSSGYVSIEQATALAGQWWRGLWFGISSVLGGIGGYLHDMGQI